MTLNDVLSYVKDPNKQIFVQNSYEDLRSNLQEACENKDWSDIAIIMKDLDAEKTAVQNVREEANRIILYI